MSDATVNTPEQPDASVAQLDDLLGYARAHAVTGDSRVWVERMLAIA